MFLLFHLSSLASATTVRSFCRSWARYYEIELIVDQPKVEHPWLVANFPVRTVAWFEVNAQRFDRVLYHFGNSVYHKHMFGLLERHPGVIVLHDFFLGHLVHWMEQTNTRPAHSSVLYMSHTAIALCWTVRKTALSLLS